jgi:hypothetical protein
MAYMTAKVQIYNTTGLGSPLSPCSTTDQRDFPIEPAHGCLLSLSKTP